MKKNDFILAGAVIAAAIVFMLLNFFVLHDSGAQVTVTVDGEVFGIYDLDEEQEIDINGTNVLEIRDGEADMISAVCPDKLCVHQKAISLDHETIVCLPNKIVAEVTGAEEAELDSVVK